MISKVLSSSLIGIRAQIIQVELDISTGLPLIIMVGLPDKSIQESKERIRTSFKSIGVEFPLAKITVNFAPADLVKAGSHYDLAISLGILKCIGGIKENIDFYKETIFLGELSLDGELRSVKGILPMIIAVKERGFKKIFIPKSDFEIANLVKGIDIFPAHNLLEIINHLNGSKLIEKLIPKEITKQVINNDIEDFKLIKGQKLAKRALLIAASGGHNVMFIGEPGSGKTLLSRAFVGILPRLNENELLEVAQIYSICGYHLKDILQYKRPFRSPHHSSSNIALTGGGNKLTPGEVSLAHRGVLFLDEFAEFSTLSIESLRQPIEDGFVQISRASGTVTYPSKFILVCASNPSPTGFENGQSNNYVSPASNARYKAKLSGPISDRIDLHITVNRPKNEELLNTADSETSEEIRKKVDKARAIQEKRFADTKIITNADMNLEQIKKYCLINDECKDILQKAIDKYKLSARAYNKILKISRTIADLEESNEIQAKHIIESLLFRPKN